MNTNRTALSPLFSALGALALVTGSSLAMAQTSAQDESNNATTPQPMQEDSARLPPAETPQSTQEPTPESMPRRDQSSEEAAMPPEDTLATQAGGNVPASVRAQFEALDTDHDGTIDANEAAASDILAQQFRALDTSGNGRLTLTEFAAAHDLALIKVDHGMQRRQ
jgi:hypothetical protein